MKRKITLVIAMTLLVIMTLSTSVFATSSEATVEFQSGNLVVDNSDSDALDMDFGAHAIPSSPESYDLTNSPKLKVVDTRGNLAGWQVLAEVSNLTGGGGTISAFSLTFNGGSVVSNATTNSPSAPSNITITASGSAQPVFVADPDASTNPSAGDGTSTITWTGPQIKLNILDVQGIKVANYSGTVTWTTSDAPA